MILKSHFQDSIAADTLIYLNNEYCPIEEAFLELKYDNQDCVIRLPNGAEIVPVKWNTTLTYIDGHIVERPINYIMRHKVSKARFRITTKSGKTVDVTGDHSCMVMRNNKLIEIKANDINKETDKIISIINEN